MILLTNCKLMNQSIVDILVCNGKIVNINNIYDKIVPLNFDIECINMKNKYVIPSYIDNHVHVIGGGGEAGFISKVPEISSIDLLSNGITTTVGVLGTDTISRSVETLVAKTKALNTDDITAFCLTGGYKYPSPTICGSVEKDISFINEIIGAKIAISDHRCYNPTKEELIKLLSEIRVAALISSKPGILNVHVGYGKGNLDTLLDILNETNIPIDCIRPTHITNNNIVFEQAMGLSLKKGYMDMTIDSDFEKNHYYLEQAKIKGDTNYITMSSDSNGSCPKWDNGVVKGMTISKPKIIHEFIKYLISEKNYSLGDAIKYVTINSATALKLYNKGKIEKGYDADLIALGENLEIDTVISKGKVIVKSRKILKRGYYE